MTRFFRIVLLLCLTVCGAWWILERPPIGHSPKTAPRALETYTPVSQAPVSSQDIPLLEQMNREYVRVSQSVIPSVVNILAMRPAMPPFDLDGETPFVLPFGPTPNAPIKPGSKKKAPLTPKEPSVGSGVIVSKEGHIITNCHVIKDCDDISVYLHDNRRYKARLIAADELADVAVLKIDAESVQPLPWGDSNKVQIGDQVFAIGNPFGLSESVSLGIVSAKGRNPSSLTAGPGSNSYEDFIQTTAAINPGNSGGALVNIQGQLIGINTAIQSTSRGFQGIGFAIPSNLARFAFEALLKNGKVTRGYLGVTIQEVTTNDMKFFRLPSESGAFVTDVEPSSPAAKLGLQAGDLIVTFNNQPVRQPAELRLLVSQTPVGNEVTLGIIRDGKPQAYSFKVAEMQPDLLAKFDSPTEEPVPDSEKLGNLLGALRVEELPPARHNHRGHKPSPSAAGVLITSVEDGSIAQSQQVHVGDIIEQIRIEGQFVSLPVSDLKSYYAIARKLKKDQGVLLLLRRGRLTTFVALTTEP